MNKQEAFNKELADQLLILKTEEQERRLKDLCADQESKEGEIGGSCRCQCQIVRAQLNEAHALMNTIGGPYDDAKPDEPNPSGAVNELFVQLEIIEYWMRSLLDKLNDVSQRI